MAERIRPEQARKDLASSNALLVCAYDSPEKWQQYRLDGAISLDGLEARLPQLPRNTELIFYCA